MPTVQLADGTPIQMPDKPTADQMASFRRAVAVSKQRASGRRMVEGSSGRRMSGGEGSHDYPSLPFTDRTVIAALDKPEEKKAFLEKKYGAGSVSQDKRGMVVKVGDKKMRVDTGILAEVTAQLPEVALGTAGAIFGAAGGPPGAIAGAIAGGAAGKSIKEATKSATGLQRQSPGEIVGSVAEAGAATGIGEGVGKLLGLAREIPLRKGLFDISSGLKKQTTEAVAKGARPPVQSTMPSAMRFQRIALLANKLSGPNKAVDRANLGYVQNKVSDLLDKAKIDVADKSDAMHRLIQGEADSALSFRSVGLHIQNVAKQLANQGGAKVKAYMKELSSPKLHPEEAFAKVTEPGAEDFTLRFFASIGKGTVVEQEVQHAALRRLLAGVMEKAVSKTAYGSVESTEKEGVNIMEAELNKYTAKQQKLLFPGGLDKDIRSVAKAVQFAMPKPKDPAMAGMTAGAIMQRIWYNRFYAQLWYSFGRAMLQKPSVIRRLAVGLEKTRTRQTAKAIIKGSLYMGALEMSNPNQDPDEHPEVKQQK